MSPVERLRSHMTYYLRKIEQYCMLNSVNLFLTPVALQNVLLKLERMQEGSGNDADMSTRSRIGSLVRLIDLHDGTVVVFELALPEQSDPQRGLLSVLSPLGSAMLGKKVGDNVDVSLFGYRHSYVVHNVS